MSAEHHVHDAAFSTSCVLGLQIAFRSFILKHKFETSYSTLAKRAAKSNNFWNRLVRRGSKARRVAMYGEAFGDLSRQCCAS